MSSILGCLLRLLRHDHQDHQDHHHHHHHRRPLEQTQSAFFSTLPAEIRLLIYKHAVPDTTRKPGVCIVRHLQVREDTTGKEERPCSSSSSPSSTSSPQWMDARFQSVFGRWGSWCESVGLHGAVLACQRMSIEAIEFLYSEPTFSLHAYGHLVAFTTLTPRSNLAHIKSLSLDLRAARYDSDPYRIHVPDAHSHSDCHSPKNNKPLHYRNHHNPPQNPAPAAPSLDKALSRLPGLRSLTISITCSQFRPDRSWEIGVLAPVWKVGNGNGNARLARFEVVVDWAPFTVEVGGVYVSEGGVRWRVARM